MLSRIGKDTAIYGASTLLVRGIQIVLIPIYTRILAPAEYGVIDLIIILGALVNLTVALEISQGVARSLAESSTPEDRCGYATSAVMFSATAYGLFALVAWMFAEPLADLLFGSGEWAGALRIAVVAMALNGVFVLLQDILRWRFRPGAYVLASVVYTLFSAGLGIYLVVFAGAGVEGVFWGQGAGAMAGALVAAFRLGDTLGLAFDGRRLRHMLAYSMPLVLSSAAVFANLFIDRIAVKYLLGIEDLGMYSVAARFASVVALLTIGLQAALTPIVFQNYRDPGTAVTVGQVFRYYCIGLMPIVGFIALFAGELLQILTGPAFYGGREVLPILVATAFFTNLYIFAPGLFIKKRTGLVAGVNVTAAALNLALCVVLVPHLGIIGAATSALMAAVFAFASYFFLGQRFYPIPYDWKRSGSVLIVGGLLVGAGIWLNSVLPVMDFKMVATKILILAAGTAVVMIVALDRDDLSRLLNLFSRKR